MLVLYREINTASPTGLTQHAQCTFMDGVFCKEISESDVIAHTYNSNTYLRSLRENSEFGTGQPGKQLPFLRKKNINKIKV